VIGTEAVLKLVSKLGSVAVVSLGFFAGAAEAQLAAPQRQVDPGSPQSVRIAGQSAEALVQGRHQDALRIADSALASDANNPWAHYHRGVALSELGRTDEAVSSFRAAEQTFSPADRWGKSIALYGRAHVLDQAGRCAEAKAAYEQYATYVQDSDPPAAGMARSYASACGRRG
jgi:tetratricopeptide (TPR) repeat protein